jgi:hypothetical protein
MQIPLAAASIQNLAGLDLKKRAVTISANDQTSDQIIRSARLLFARSFNLRPPFIFTGITDEYAREYQLYYLPAGNSGTVLCIS